MYLFMLVMALPAGTRLLNVYKELSPEFTKKRGNSISWHGGWSVFVHTTYDGIFVLTSEE